MSNENMSKYRTLFKLTLLVVSVVVVRKTFRLLEDRGRYVGSAHRTEERDTEYEQDSAAGGPVYDESLYSPEIYGNDTTGIYDNYYDEWKPDPDFIFIEPAAITAEHLQTAGKQPESAALIPRIIHQMWDTYSVPNLYIQWIKKTLSLHPGWEYWFWRREDMDCYLQHLHPQHYPTYLNYSSMLYRSDFMRYFILYDYGGLYFDLDVEVMKPMDPWRFISPNIISYETYEHFFFVYQGEREYPNLINTILMSAPNHPYYKLLQENLAEFQKKYDDVMFATGPFFIDAMLQRYIHTHNITHWAVPPHSHHDSNLKYNMTIIDPKYWLSTFDPIRKGTLEGVCILTDIDDFPSITHTRFKGLRKDICKKNIAEKFKNRPYEGAYLDHHWVHSISKNRTLFYYRNTSLVNEVIPGFRSVSDRLGLNCKPLKN